MNKFKKGDTVRFISPGDDDSYPAVNDGAIGWVMHVDIPPHNYPYRIKFITFFDGQGPGFEAWLREDELEKVE
jgi:hypothetical protein